MQCEFAYSVVVASSSSQDDRFFFFTISHIPLLHFEGIAKKMAEPTRKSLLDVVEKNLKIINYVNMITLFALCLLRPFHVCPQNNSITRNYVVFRVHT